MFYFSIKWNSFWNHYTLNSLNEFFHEFSALCSQIVKHDEWVQHWIQILACRVCVHKTTAHSISAMFSHISLDAYCTYTSVDLHIDYPTIVQCLVSADFCSNFVKIIPFHALEWNFSYFLLDLRMLSSRRKTAIFTRHWYALLAI